MKLLIVTQAVDVQEPAGLGFFISWIEKFSRECESVEVICLRKGEYALPGNVRVHSLGKEERQLSKSRLGSRIGYSLRFLQLTWQLRNSYDAVFVHMNPEYLVIAGWLWRMLGKKIGLWYMHKSVTRSLRIGVFFAHRVFTASPDSFRIPTPKLRVMGHGIDMVPLPQEPTAGGELRILSLGRLSESKGIRESIAALDMLHARGVSFSYTVVGSPVTSADRTYAQTVQAEVRSKPYAASVAFVGAVHHPDIPRVLSRADVFLHLSDTGSLDKAALEALLAGVPVVTSNDSVKQMVPRAWQVHRDDADDIATALLAARGSDMKQLVDIVKREHALSTLVPRIVDDLRPRYRAWGSTALRRVLLLVRDVRSIFANSPEVSVLCYHSISDAEVDTALSAHTFEEQLIALRRSGAEFVALERVIAWHQGVGVMSRRAVALTFDDGYADFMHAALPILERHGAPATLFVVGDAPAARARLGNTIPLLTDQEIESLKNHPLVSIGYHSRTHANPMDPNTDSVTECAPRFGASVFAYPGGKYTDEYIMALKAAGYSAACTIKPELVEQGTNVFLLPRAVIVSDTPLWMVRYYTTLAVAWYRRARRTLRS